MNISKNPRLLFHSFRYMPIHPQWFAYRCERKRYKLVGHHAKGRLLDIGCGRQGLRKYLDPSITYLSLDFPETGIKLYNAKPSLFGDAGKLPFSKETFDTVVLLEVLEHLPNPIVAIQEARRILKKGGVLILSTPFLYPIHDAPKDYQRWTQHGLEQLIGLTGLIIRDLHKMGSPVETGILLFNLSLAWFILHTPLIARFPLLLLAMITIPSLNVLGITISHLCKEPKNTPFAIGYLLMAQEPSK